jgi:hypothetical protein
MKKTIVAVGLVVLAGLAVAATYTNNWTDGLFSGNVGDESERGGSDF